MFKQVLMSKGDFASLSHFTGVDPSPNGTQGSISSDSSDCLYLPMISLEITQAEVSTEKAREHDGIPCLNQTKN